MKKFLIALITCFLTAVSNAELRTWTAVNGKKVKANFVSSTNGIVKLRLESGKIFEVANNKLSKKDNEFIAGLYKAEAIGSGIKAKPKPKIPVNLDQYRNAFADPSDRTDPYFIVTTWRYLTNKYKKTKSNYVNGLVEDVIFLFGEPDKKERSRQTVKDLTAMAIAEIRGDFSEKSKTLDFVVYTYKDFWTDAAIDKKNDLSIFLRLNEPTPSELKAAKILKKKWKPRVINDIKNTELYWEGYYTNFKNNIIDLDWAKDADLSEYEKQLPKKDPTISELEKKKPNRVFTLSSGLVAYYPFNGNANDESKNANNGMVNGAKLSADRNGNRNSAYSFDGIDDFIEIKNSPELNFDDKMSVSFWIKPENSFWNIRHNQAGIICKMKEQDQGGVHYQNGYLFGHDHHHGRTGFMTFTSRFRAKKERASRDGHHALNNGYIKETISSKSKLEVNRWVHWAFTYSAESIKYYKNGELDSKYETGTISDLSTISPLYIGVSNYWRNWYRAPENYPIFYSGSIDDIRIYDEDLSADEVLKIYESEK